MTKGIYALIIKIKDEISLKIGKNKNYRFFPGYYVYIGSALGIYSNNIEARLKRHFSRTKKLFWHIDYLLASPKVEPVKAFYAITELKMECRLSVQLQNFSNFIIFENFGNSDCQAGCKTHLYYFNNISNLEHVVISSFKNINLEPRPYKQTN